MVLQVVQSHIVSLQGSTTVNNQGINTDVRQMKITNLSTKNTNQFDTMKFAAATLLALASPASACVKVDGKVTQDVTVTMVVKLVDNGVTICDGNWTGNKDSGEISCNDGYKLTATTTAIADPVKFEYETPHGKYTFLSDDPGCSFTNCCSRKSFIFICSGGRFYEVTSANNGLCSDDSLLLQQLPVLRNGILLGQYMVQFFLT